MAKGKMTSAHQPAMCPQDPVTRHKGVFCTLGSFHQQVSSWHTRVSEAPELSFEKLSTLLNTLCCSPPRSCQGEEEAKGNKSQSTSSVNKIQFLSQRLQDCRQFKTRTGEFVNREEEEFQASEGLV